MSYEVSIDNLAKELNISNDEFDRAIAAGIFQFQKVDGPYRREDGSIGSGLVVDKTLAQRAYSGFCKSQTVDDPLTAVQREIGELQQKARGQVGSAHAATLRKVQELSRKKAELQKQVGEKLNDPKEFDAQIMRAEAYLKDVQARIDDLSPKDQWGGKLPGYKVPGHLEQEYLLARGKLSELKRQAAMNS